MHLDLLRLCSKKNQNTPRPFCFDFQKCCNSDAKKMRFHFVQKQYVYYFFLNFFTQMAGKRNNKGHILRVTFNIGDIWIYTFVRDYIHSLHAIAAVLILTVVTRVARSTVEHLLTFLWCFPTYC